MTESQVIVCTPKSLPQALRIKAAHEAIRINPVNRPPVERMRGLMRGFQPTPQRIAVMVTDYWGPRGVKLTVGFLDNPSLALRRRIVSHMNAWNRDANVSFLLSGRDSDVRIARMNKGKDRRYWSYTGTEITQIEPDKPTMNLEGFTMLTEEAEFHRVVRHETGHTLGFPHEHMRRAFVQRIDRKKAIAYFWRTERWKAQDTIEQVLTPIEEATLRGTVADPKSIMCYQIPGEITKDGKPIVGGLDIDESDYRFAGRIYPKNPGMRTARPGARKKRG